MMFASLSKKHRLVREYRWATDKSGDSVREYLFRRRKEIRKHLGFATFKEMTLNYRILFNRHNKKKIVHDYVQYVMKKPQRHKSDVAISYNIIASIGVDVQLEHSIIDFMLERLRFDLPERVFLLAINSHYSVRKHVIMDYVKKHIIIKTPRINT